jgi:RNA polymerase sigma-70 factor (ECF subfamily)
MTEDQPEGSADRLLADRFLQRRDEGAFRNLYRAHTPYLLCLALRLSGGSREDAEDAVQETWLRATRALPSFRWESRLRTWLSGILINCCREQQRRATRDERSEPAREASPHAGTSLDLETAVSGLPDGLREVLVLHVIEGYTHEEIGGLLGIAEGTSKSRLFDARLALRRRLGERPEGAGP